MPPKRASFEQTFNANLLEPGALAAPDGLQTALDAIQKACYRDDLSIMGVITGLSRSPHILEYIFSGALFIPTISMGLMKQTALVVLDDKAYEILSKWIVSQFPTSATPNAMEALGIELLQRLSSSLTSVEGVSTTEHRNELRESRRKVDLYLNVLKELGKNLGQALADTNAPPTSRKRSKAPARHIQFDPHPFDCVRIAVPVTIDEARTVCGDVLSQLQNVLRVSITLSFGLPSKHLPAFSTTCSFSGDARYRIYSSANLKIWES